MSGTVQRKWLGGLGDVNDLMAIFDFYSFWRPFFHCVVIGYAARFGRT